MQNLIESVLHPTDFSEGSKVAFYHALKVALLAKSKLTLLNVTSDGNPRWANFPGVRETLEHWELLPEGSPREAVGDLGIDVRKAILKSGDPVKAVVDHLQKRPAELIVLNTSQNKGSMGWMSSSVAEPIARHAREMTLFIAGDSKGFISAQDGSVSLSRILIPVAETPEAQPALDAAARLVTSLGCSNGDFTLLHIGDVDTMPEVFPPVVPGWEWNTEVVKGDVIETIVGVSRKADADLIVMTTDGRNGFLDGLRGSHSERVLRMTQAPVLTVPLGSHVYDFVG